MFSQHINYSNRDDGAALNAAACLLTRKYLLCNLAGVFQNLSSSCFLLPTLHLFSLALVLLKVWFHILCIVHIFQQNSSIFCENHFILCMLKGLLSSANIFLVKATLNGWAIARGKTHSWWQTKVTSEQQINYSLRKGAAIKDKLRPRVTHSVNDCVIYLGYDVVTAKYVGGLSRISRQKRYTTWILKLFCKCKPFLSG